VPDDSASSPADVVVSGPAWKPGLDDLARFRALSRKGGVMAHSVVQGSSMGATLPAGSRIRIKSGPEDSWSRGEVIAFLAGSRVMAHRVVAAGRGAASKDFLITQGDNNWLCDPPVHRSAVIGSVETMTADGEWSAISGAAMPWLKHAVAKASQVPMRALLDASPRLAIRVSKAISWLRMGPRLTLSIGRRLIHNVWN
jgi:hypothetical protein